MVAAHHPPAPPAVVRAWSRALNANDNEAAAEQFAPGARVIQPGVDVRVNAALALAFNESRPRHRCDAPGQKVAAVFTIRRGRITRCQQVPAPADPTPPA